MDVPTLVANTDAFFGTHHVDIAAVHAAHLPHVDGKFRLWGLALYLSGFILRIDLIFTRNDRNFFFCPHAGVDFNGTGEQIDILRIVAAISIQATAFNTNNPALDLIPRKATVLIKLRFTCGEGHATRVDGAAAITNNSRWVSDNHLRFTASHFEEAFNLARVIAVDFIQDNARRGFVWVKIRVALDHPCGLC